MVGLQYSEEHVFERNQTIHPARTNHHSLTNHRFICGELTTIIVIFQPVNSNTTDGKV